MSVSVPYAIDPLTITALTTAGYTTLELWYSDTPDGAYANSSATVSPATLALMTSGETYTATFTYSGGNVAQWFRVRAFDGGSTRTPMSDSTPFHGGGGTTLVELRQRTGDEIRDMKTGTLTGATDATTAIVSEIDITRYPADYFNNWLINNRTQGAWGNITDWATPNLTTSSITGQTTGDLIELTKRFTPDEYRRAINWAIRTSYPALSRPVIHTGVMTAANLYQYTVPSSIRSVARVEIESGAFNSSSVQATRGYPWTEVRYRLLSDGLVLTIEFDQQLTVNRRFRIRGSAALPLLNADTDYVPALEPQTDIIIFYAAHHLFRGLVADSASSDTARFQALADFYFQRAHQLRRTVASRRSSKRLFGRDMAAGSSIKEASLLSASFLTSNYD